MTAIAFSTAPRMAAVGSKVKGLFQRLGNAIDAFAAYRTQHVVPESEIRRAEREIARYRRLMHAGQPVSS